jgi:hypothetical protein
MYHMCNIVIGNIPICIVRVDNPILMDSYILYSICGEHIGILKWISSIVFSVKKVMYS